MKKLVIILSIFTLFAALFLTACPPPDTHTHDFSGDWHFDETQHWKECPEDNAKGLTANHTLENGVCVCGYDDESGTPAPACDNAECDCDPCEGEGCDCGEPVITPDPCVCGMEDCDCAENDPDCKCDGRVDSYGTIGIFAGEGVDDDTATAKAADFKTAMDSLDGAGSKVPEYITAKVSRVELVAGAGIITLDNGILEIGFFPNAGIMRAAINSYIVSTNAADFNQWAKDNGFAAIRNITEYKEAGETATVYIGIWQKTTNITSALAQTAAANIANAYAALETDRKAAMKGGIKEIWIIDGANACEADDETGKVIFKFASGVTQDEAQSFFEECEEF